MKGEWTNTVKVQCSPDGRLRNLVQSKLNETRGPDGGLTKVIESVGTSVFSGMKKNPFQSSKCKYNEECCIDPKDDCSRAKAVYRIECNLCKECNNTKSWYTGTTGHTVHSIQLLPNSKISLFLLFEVASLPYLVLFLVILMI